MAVEDAETILELVEEGTAADELWTVSAVEDDEEDPAEDEGAAEVLSVDKTLAFTQ